MIFHSELPQDKRVGGLENAVYDITKALNQYTDVTHARLGDHFPRTLKGVQMVHFHGLWSQDHIKLAKLCADSGIPYIVSPHGMLEPWALQHKGLKKWLHRLIYTDTYLQQAECILATSKMEERHIQELFPGQTTQSIPLGIRELPEKNHKATRAKFDIKDDTFHLLYLSRIDVKKNLLPLIQSLESVAKQIDQKIHLTVIGEGFGPYYTECLELARTTQTQKVSISLKGPIWDDSKWDWLASADLFCLPSSSENFGYAYLESLAVGTPILTTDGTPWAQHGDRPFVHLCEPEEKSIANTIIQAHSRKAHPEDRERARILVFENYLWESLATDYKALYPSLNRDEKNTHSPF